MPNTTLDKAIAAVPKFKVSISLFTKKPHLAQYADGSIYDYRLKIAQALLSIINQPSIVGETKPILFLRYFFNIKKSFLLISYLSKDGSGTCPLALLPLFSPNLFCQILVASAMKVGNSFFEKGQ